MADDVRILLVPGVGGSDAIHWDHAWEREDQRIERIIQADWNSGTRQQWVECIENCVAASTIPTFLVAHSTGCVAVAHFMAKARNSVRGALLVAPADVEQDWAPVGSFYREFRPIPRVPFPVPSVLVASTNDPYLSIERARSLAGDWKSKLEVVGAADHIGSDSSVGDWPQGKQFLDDLIKTASS